MSGLVGVFLRQTGSPEDALGEFERLLKVNFVGALRVSRTLLPLLKDFADEEDSSDGKERASSATPLWRRPWAAAFSSFFGLPLRLSARLVWVGSAASGRGPPGQAAYAASKAALSAAAAVLHAELLGSGVSVCCFGELVVFSRRLAPFGKRALAARRRLARAIEGVSLYRAGGDGDGALFSKLFEGRAVWRTKLPLPAVR